MRRRFSRRSRRRPRFNRRRRFVRARSRRLRRPRRRSNGGNLRYKITVPGISVTTSSNAATGWYTYSLDKAATGHSRVGAFQSMYDLYRIRAVSTRFVPRWTNQNLNLADATENVSVRFATALEFFRNNSTPPTIASLEQASYFRMTYNAKPHVRYFKPRPLIAAFQNFDSSVAVDVPGGRGQWYPTSYGGFEYAGLVASVEIAGPVVDLTWDVIHTYYLQFKNWRAE